MRSVEVFGERFRLVDRPPQWALMKFAKAAASLDSNELAAMGAILNLLERCIHPDDWQRFDRAADSHDVDVERDLMPVVVAVFTDEAERPTSQPSDSSAGLQSTAGSSTVPSSSPVMDRLAGRPDLMVIVEDMQSARRTG